MKSFRVLFPVLLTWVLVLSGCQGGLPDQLEDIYTEGAAQVQQLKTRLESATNSKLRRKIYKEYQQQIKQIKQTLAAKFKQFSAELDAEAQNKVLPKLSKLSSQLSKARKAFHEAWLKSRQDP